MSLRRPYIVLSVLLLLPVIHVTTSLAASVTVTWTAPGDDSLSGRASGFDLRYSSAMITTENFLQANAAVDLPTPGPAGTIQSVRIDALLPNRLYYFAIKSIDHAGNWSAMSNVISRWPQSVVAAEIASKLSFSAPWPSPARDATQFRLELPDPVRVQVEVYDVSGRRVRTLLDEPRGAGIKNLAFDLRDEQGARLAQGVYLVRAQLGEAVMMRRLVITR